MKIYSKKSEYTLLQGNMLDMGDFVGGGTIDSIVTDPPYELNFMGKGWDNSGIAFQPDTWKRCLEALKPGGYLLAFGGSRTYHRIACAIEDAGFEIRDCIMWLYGSGFPKSMNIGLAIDKKNGIEVKNNYSGPNYKNSVYGKAMGGGITIETQKAQNKWNGWGTALKPSYEPIIVARKPLEGSCTDNVIKYGVGGINIDECRVGTDEEITNHSRSKKAEENNMYQWGKEQETHQTEGQALGRFPANTILTYDESDFEEVCGGFPDTKSGSKMSFGSVRKAQPDNTYQLGFTKKENGGQTAPDNYGDSGNASRYFYCAKASKRDRNEGLGEEFEEKINSKMFRTANNTSDKISKGFERFDTKPSKNNHPTVKPTDLMQYLVRLVTPNGGTVLDPFNGSGSTGKAVMYENKDRNKNYKYIGIELTEEYLPIAKARIEYVINKGIEKEKSEPKQEEQTKQRKESALF